MDATGPLESIAKLLPGLPEEAVESLLVSFDALAGVGNAACRPAAAQILRDTAALCTDGTRRERLLKAAGSMAAGEPCALTPDGLSWKQAAATQTMTMEEWQKREAEAPLPPPPADTEDTEESAVMEEEPPSLPHLRVRHFFPGLVVRAGRDFRDAQGRAVCAGEVLRLLRCDRADSDDGYVLSFLERTVRLSTDTPGHEEVIENAGNRWFQPVPAIACLEDLWEAVDIRLQQADEDEGDDDPDDLYLDRLEEIRDDVGKCEEWLNGSGARGPAPECTSGRLAAGIFGRDSEMAVWVPLLFAAMAVSKPDS